MSEFPDPKAYYQKEAEISDFKPGTDASELLRCAAAWSVFPKGEVSSVLDVGCGDGYFCHWISRKTALARVAGVDISEPRLARARSRFPDIEYTQGIIPELPFGDAEFELTTCIEVIEHLPDPLLALGELKRITSKHVVITVPDRRPVHDLLCPHCLKKFPADGHLHSFNPDSLRKLVEDAGLKVEQLSVFHITPYALRNAFLRTLGKCFSRLDLLLRPRRGKYIACRAVRPE